MEIKIRVPRAPAWMGANLVLLCGLVAIAVAVGGLSGNWWWTVLTGGVFATGLSVWAMWTAPAPGQPSAGEETRPVPRIAAVS